MLKDKVLSFVKNPKTIEIAKGVATTVIYIVVLNAVAVLVHKGVEAGIDAITGTASNTETPAE